MRTYVAEAVKQIGQTVTVKGFIDVRRDHGKLIFLDLRDASGIVQAVVNPKVAPAAHRIAQELRSEFVVEVEGRVNKRPENLVNPNLPTGTVEVEVAALKILSRAKALPFELTDTKPVNEETRLKYRYLDLRTSRMTKNLKLRHQVTTLARQYLNERRFIEVETPILTKTSPEGARDFLVPSRLQPGKFYALPQAPQQYKQLLMIAGLERYYQIAKALRDEDLRGDRQLEHTQIDLEMSYDGQEGVLNLIEGLMIHIAQALNKKVFKTPFPRYTYDEAMREFGADKFDLRLQKSDPNTLAFAWVTDMPLFEWVEEEKHFTFAHNPFSAPKPQEVERVMQEKDLGALRAQQYDLVCNGFEIGSGGVRISDPKLQRQVFKIMGLGSKQTEERFGHLLQAYEYGAPPHAGIALGLDRLVMILANEDNIREVMAFPVTSSGTTAVMEAPSPADPRQLKELHLKIDLAGKKGTKQ